jgi:LPXTG-motif cell wall-anchored protein
MRGHKRGKQRRIALFATFLVATAGFLSAFSAGGGAVVVEPVRVGGNPNCATYDGAAEWVHYKYNGNILSGLTVGVATVVNVPRDGGSGTLAVTITKLDDFSFDWSTTTGLRAVIVKASNAANVYLYDPAATSGEGLVSVEKDDQSGYHAISHVSFCVGASSATTTTTTAASTTTTVPEETTTTTVPEETTTTTVPEETTTTTVPEETTTTTVPEETTTTTVPEETTTTTVPEETTTTTVEVQESTTTTTGTTDTTVGTQETTTTTQGTTTTTDAPVTPTGGPTLPRTGQDIALVFFGLVMLVSGSGLLVTARQQRRDAHVG